MRATVHVSLWFWVGFNALVLLLLALDLGVVNRKAHVVSTREAALTTAGWVALALCFNLGVWWYAGSGPALEWMSGYLIEESLSIDNIFVFVMLFRYFAVPAQYQHRVLFWGVLGAVVLRGIFIAAGTLLLSRFHWVGYLFGLLLLITGARMALTHDEGFQGESNPVLRFARRVLPMTHEYDGPRLVTRRDGRRLATPLMLVLILVEVTDLLFAIDSIPAVFAVTRDPFIVYTSNVFAILGLRSLYFLVAGMATRFRFLRYGLAAILAFVGAKMITADLLHIPVLLSLGVIAALLALAIGISVAVPPPPDASGPAAPG